MKSSFKLLTLITTAFFMFSMEANAEVQSRVETLEKQMKEISNNFPNEGGGLGFEEQSLSLSLQFDMLYWYTKMGGTEYAYSFVPHFSEGHSSSSHLEGKINGRMQGNHFSWDPGFRLGARYKTEHDDWEIQGSYTYFRNQSEDSSSQSYPGSLFSFRNIGVLFSSEIKSDVKITYQDVEAGIGNPLFFSSYLSFRPLLNLKASWLDLSQNLQITAFSPSHGMQPFEFNGLDYKTVTRYRVQGVGPSIGVESQWFFGERLHLFSKLSGALEYSFISNINEEYFPPVAFENGKGGKAIEIEQKLRKFIPSTSLLIGLGYGMPINDHKQHLDFKLGYEVQYFHGINQIMTNNQSPVTFKPEKGEGRIGFQRESNDLMFFGLTGAISYAF